MCSVIRKKANEENAVNSKEGTVGDQKSLWGEKLNIDTIENR